MSASPAFQRFADQLLASVPALAAGVCERAHAQLQAASKAQAVAGDRQHTLAVLQATRPGVQGLAAAFSAALREQLREEATTFAATNAPLQPADTEPSLDSLTLVDDAQIEEDIEVARVIQLVDTAAEAELRDLRALLATLRGAEEARPELHPMRPEVCARALVRALHQSGLAREPRLMALRVVGRELAERLQAMYRAQLSELRRLGVKPVAYKLRLAPEAAGAVANHDAAMQQLAGRVASGAEQAAARLIPQLLGQVAEQAALAPPLRALLERLAPPAIRSARAGAGVLASFEHPLWRLVDRISALGAVQGGRQGPDTLAGLLEPIVATLERSGDATNAAYERALAALDERATGWADSQLLESGAAEPVADAGQSLPTDWGGEGSLPTVPMPLGDAGDPVHRVWLDALREGDWLRVFLQARWITLQLSGRSSTQALLAARDGGTMQSLSWRALLRLREQGLATTIDRARAVRRAVDTLTLDLAP